MQIVPTSVAESCTVAEERTFVVRAPLLDTRFVRVELLRLRALRATATAPGRPAPKHPDGAASR